MVLTTHTTIFSVFDVSGSFTFSHGNDVTDVHLHEVSMTATDVNNYTSLHHYYGIHRALHTATHCSACSGIWFPSTTYSISAAMNNGPCIQLHALHQYNVYSWYVGILLLHTVTALYTMCYILYVIYTYPASRSNLTSPCRKSSLKIGNTTFQWRYLFLCGVVVYWIL